MSLLTSLWAVPALGAAACALSGRAARWTALVFSLAALGLSMAALRPILVSHGAGLLVEGGASGLFGISYSLSADGLSLALVALTAFLNLICAFASWELEVPAGYWAAFQALAAAVNGVFLARDLFLFYVFWEASLIPMFFIIGLWGSDNRRKAALKFFLFTFTGSIFMLLALLAVVIAHQRATGVWTWSLPELTGTDLGAGAPWILLALMAGFGVKVPMVPLHTWLPDAHTEAPAAGSVMLAGVMLKMGVYGIIRVALPLVPGAAAAWMPILALLAGVNAVYGALCAMAQTDLKRLIAYSSIAHLGFCLIGVFSGTAQGLAGAALLMINHGVTTGALFLLVGFLYERAHRRGLSDFGALATRAPRMAFFFGFSILASIGLPGLNGFVGEFMCLSGAAQSPILFGGLPFYALIGAIGVTLAAAYALPAFQSVFWAAEGPNSVSPKVFDLGGRESAILWTLCALMLWIGLAPQPWLATLAPSLQGLVR